jgi:hypothetical protein
MTSCTYDMPRSACSVALETYHGASTIILRIFEHKNWLHRTVLLENTTVPELMKTFHACTAVFTRSHPEWQLNFISILISFHLPGCLFIANFVYISSLPRVEAGKNTSTAVRGEGNGTELVLGETVPADLREG